MQSNKKGHWTHKKTLYCKISICQGRIEQQKTCNVHPRTVHCDSEFRTLGLFSRSFYNGKIRAWRRYEESYHDARVVECDRYGGRSMMMWGGIGKAYRTPLCVVQGDRTGVIHKENILHPLLLPALQAIGPAAVFQDNNFRPNMARIINDFLQQHQANSKAWPACSP